MLRGGTTLLIITLVAYSSAFYLPGVAPRSYADGEPLPLLVNRLDSTETIMPFDYYYFDFCEPGEDPMTGETSPHVGAKVSENLGEILLGERIRHSPYKIKMLEDQACRPLCTRKYQAGDADSVAKHAKILNAIKKDYMHNWIIDGLPAVECTANCRDDPLMRLGFPLGCALGAGEGARTVCTAATTANMDATGTYLNNHVDLIISYHQSPEFVGSRVVGIEVRPRSIRHAALDTMNCGRDAGALAFTLDAPTTGTTTAGSGSPQAALSVIYSYSVTFRESELKWASRWDPYLRSAEGAAVHWFSIVNSLVIALFLAGLVAAVLVRTLHRDIARYNQSDGGEEAQEEYGWKLVHGDVFRAPRHAMLLSVLLGSGAQLASMATLVLVFAVLGFLSPASRGALMTATVVLFVCLGTPAGYVAARLYKTWGGERWKSNVLLTALLVPGVVFAVAFVLNVILWAEASSAAVPFGTLVAVVALWFFVSVPLTFLGAYFGFRKPPFEHPVRTNQIPRQVPPQPLLARAVPAVLLGGVLPFGCVFIQLFFILNSIWGHHIYYVFGFLLLVFVLLAATTVESTVLLCYFQLCAENYHWWWRAFLTSGSSALGVFVYALVFYAKHMEVDGKANLALYFGYTTIMALLYFLTTATIGFFGCYYFVQRIYASVKVD